MDKRFSEMNKEELRTSIAQLSEKARRAEQMGMVNEFAVHERRIALAKSYLLNPDDFTPGKTYELEGDPGSSFVIDYMNGTFAWGFRKGSETIEAFPISMLIEKEQQ
ncbi:YfhH family protein [Alkalihalobacillus sp. CinArs1]|uniref:YfhH family protein n=1 Tax=Alkalihalobacillus sp. CinArs1 TaxID=2995314 RepID=UPI0022DD53A6|nr:YfhH family protein [Alkalihalobacillus sp. CinArs1]